MIRTVYNLYFSKEKRFIRHIRLITGYTPKETFLYHLALRHSSLVSSRKNSHMECNERLEFLGDTILDSVVSEYLFKLYPTKDEGFLTEMRAKIVNRGALNEICKKLNLDDLIRFNKSRKGQVNKSMYGDALEAFIGAFYMDLGYAKTRKFIINRILVSHLDLNDVETTIFNFKSMLLEYVQKEKLDNIVYDTVSEKGDGNDKVFRVQVKIGEKVMGIGEGKKKKVAEQNASENALIRLNVINSESQQSA